MLAYSGRDPLTAIVRVLRPAPVPNPAGLRITPFTISPSSPVERNNARATVTIRNAGQTAARNFYVQRHTEMMRGLAPNLEYPGLVYLFWRSSAASQQKVAHTPL